MNSIASPLQAQAATTVERKHQSVWKIGAATMVGTAIEAFDFLAYGTAAALVFNKLFFPNFDPTVGTLAAFGTFASGMLARPLGGIIFGHYGDRLGRKSMLTLSLLLMGICTVLIGLLPTYESIGLWAAVLLVLLRIGQGLSFGGELGGAMLMAVEHAPPKWKSLVGSMPQMGAPIGVLLSSGAFALVTQLPEASFLSWGWRLPFLASAVLIVLGVFIRMKVQESPEFMQVKVQQKTAALPAREVVVAHLKPLLLTIGGKLAEVTLIYTILVFSISYATSRLEPLALRCAARADRRLDRDGLHHSGQRLACRQGRRAAALRVRRAAAGGHGGAAVPGHWQRIAHGVHRGHGGGTVDQLPADVRAAVEPVCGAISGRAALFGHLDRHPVRGGHRRRACADHRGHAGGEVFEHRAGGHLCRGARCGGRRLCPG